MRAKLITNTADHPEYTLPMVVAVLCRGDYLLFIGNCRKRRKETNMEYIWKKTC